MQGARSVGMKRKPQALKVLQGTDRKDREHPEPDLPAVDGEVEAPDWLTGPEAVKEWDRLVGLLQPAGVLTEDNLSALGHLCNMHADAVKRWRLGDKPTAADLTQLRLMYAEFGMTPASRSKAGSVGEGPKGNPFESLKTG